MHDHRVVDMRLEKVAPKGEQRARNPWGWVPSLYLAEGLPYVVAMTVSVILYKRLGISNAEIAFYTSWLYLPWVIKPLWSPFVEMIGTNRKWIVLAELLIGGLLAAIALTLPMSGYFQFSLALFWLLAFSSATHDIAVDGFYMLALPQKQQSAFVGVRSTFYRIAMISGQGALVVLAGYLEEHSGGNIRAAWSWSFAVVAAGFVALSLYHRFILPFPNSDRRGPEPQTRNLIKEFVHIFVLFFQKKEIGAVLAFLLFYRFAEAQLVKLVTPFLLDATSAGGLGLSTTDVGIVYGTVGIVALTVGGLLGGYVISRRGLRFWLWPMVLAIHLPDLVFIYLSQTQPGNLYIINAAVAVEQFGYGFGFTAYMMYMIMISDGEHKTAHYAICTGVMALGMMLPGMASGAIQETIGYKSFFLWIVLSTIPGFVVASYVKIDPEFGRKTI